MALLKRISKNAKTDETTGFGTNRSMYGGRLVNKDGSANVRKTGLPIFDHLSWFHTMIHMPRWKFLLLLLGVYLVTNLIFAFIYYFIGVESLGQVLEKTPMGRFWEAFFFSTETFTTVGYGRVNPTGFWSNLVAALEAFLGLLNFALATGLLYGRFSKPKAFLKFSESAIIAPYQGQNALMFRMAPYKNNTLTDAEVKLTFYITEDAGDRKLNRFYSLDLEYSKVNSLNLSWTVVHPISESSPLYNLCLDDLKAANAELMVFVRAFDETFSNNVVARTSYIADEFIYGARFLPMYHRSSDGRSTTLDLAKLNAMEFSELPVPVEEEIKAGVL